MNSVEFVSDFIVFTMVDFSKRFPVVMLISEDYDLLKSMKQYLFSFGTKFIFSSRSISDVPSNALKSASLLFLDIMALDDLSIDSLNLRTPNCLSVVLCEPGNYPPLWKLLKWGIDDIFDKSISLETLKQRLFILPPNHMSSIHSLARSWVGWQGLKDIQKEIRDVMYEEALNQSSGNKCKAARLLQVTRGAVQKVCRENEWDNS